MIDDIPADLDTTKRLIVGIAPKTAFEAFSGFINQSQLLASFPTAEAFDGIDLCFVDLELFGSNFGSEHPNSGIAITGATVVLPLLRERAPWIPVIAVSRYLRGETFTSQPVIGCYPFDAVLSKSAFSDSGFHFALWKSIVHQTKINALERCIHGRAGLGQGLTFSYDADRSLAALFESAWDRRTGCTKREFVEEKCKEALSLLQVLFSFASKTVVESMPTGHSGDIVLKVTTELPITSGVGSGSWILKISNKPSRLLREANAHREVLKTGVEYVHLAPMLFPSVVAIAHCGVVIYRHARNQGTALVCLRKHYDHPLFLKGLTAPLKSLYQTPIARLVQCDVLLKTWFAKRKFARIQSNLGVWTNLDEFTGLYKSALGKATQCSESFVHGDLHLSNILIGEPMTLIDLSRAGSGPIVVDVAKLASDLWLEFPETYALAVPSWGGLLDNAIWRDFVDALLPVPTEGDRLLFDACMQLYLAGALDYYDCLREAQAKERALLALASAEWTGGGNV